MKRLLSGLVLILSLGLASCGPCKSSGDCAAGEHCDLDKGDCVASCRSDSDCASTARCDLDIGRCEPRNRPPLFPPEDAAFSDATTSTAADAAAGD